MLLKVSDGSGGWVLLDQVSQVHILPVRSRVRNRDDLHTLMESEGEPPLCLISAESLKAGTPIEVGRIGFERFGQSRVVLFTSVAFVCNDNGDTIERVNAGNSGSQGARRR